MIEKDFNLSGKPDEKQISAQREKERVQKIEKINDPAERRKANTMLNGRDHLIDGLKAQAKQQEENSVQAEIQKKAAHKHEFHIKPPQGMARNPEPQKRESYIRTSIRNNLGKKLDDGIKQVERGENKKIDSFVKTTLKKEQVKSKTTKEDFKQNAKDMTGEKSRNEKAATKETASRSKKASRGRSRARTRSR